MIIKYAFYGDIACTRVVDVTKYVVNNFMGLDEIKIPAGFNFNAVFGDPIPLTHKFLTIVLGTGEKITVSEYAVVKNERRIRIGDQKLGFVITRHVNSVITNRYWKRAYESIRKYYTEEIIIVDDGSDPQFLVEDIDLYNCRVIKADVNFKGAGELLSYYYFHMLKSFDKMVFVHDSVWLNTYIDFYGISRTTFLWTFPHDFNNEIEEKEVIQCLDNYEEIERLYDDKTRWGGCFGVMSVCLWADIDAINRRYAFFDRLLPIVRTRPRRMCLERVYACVCNAICPDTPVMYGRIAEYTHWGSDEKAYLDGKLNHLPIIKVWTGR